MQQDVTMLPDETRTCCKARQQSHVMQAPATTATTKSLPHKSSVSPRGQHATRSPVRRQFMCHSLGSHCACGGSVEQPSGAGLYSARIVHYDAQPTN
mmetsp:Transcript_88044/g.235553  ORF Transcript_88044/g.235553 Transcript_88044/m.235553 type:complete len:97 (-) Transcript_88044:93-383(-)